MCKNEEVLLYISINFNEKITCYRKIKSLFEKLKKIRGKIDENNKKFNEFYNLFERIGN